MTRRRIPRAAGALAALAALVVAARAPAATYYVRQTVGDDAHDGTSPERAWRTLGRLAWALGPGDTAYVGPGLYREELPFARDGTPEARIVLVADTTGQHTGDPPGTVLIAGSDPVDEAAFTAHPTLPGVWSAPHEAIAGVVEMDGPQRRYRRADGEGEKRPALDVLRDTPSCWYWDPAERRLHVHTSDGRAPTTHELEVIRRGNGIALPGRRHVTIVGFAIRHVADAGINFWKGSHDGIAIDNVAWGSRQGIRVYAATDVALHRNLLFRNDNSGAYFAAASLGGVAMGNRAWENAKGLRWSSGSNDAVVMDNVLFDNDEAGLALEKSDRALVRRNVLAHNRRYQLLAIDAAFSSDANCFATRPGQLVADFLYTEHFRTLPEYRAARRQEATSREGSCGPLPAKLDVRKIHAETSAYAERARKALAARR